MTIDESVLNLVNNDKENKGWLWSTKAKQAYSQEKISFDRLPGADDISGDAIVVGPSIRGARMLAISLLF